MELGAALTLGTELLRGHGLADWTLTLDRAKTRAAVCRSSSRTISLSAHLTALHPEEEVRDTILHEIAHALVGARHGHDAVWRAKALEIGCSGQRCSSVDAPRLEGPWAGTCPAGHVVRRHRRPTRVGLCGLCRGPERQRLLDWTHHGVRVPMHPNYVAELAAFLGGRPQHAPGRLRPGAPVRISAEGRYHGMAGWVVGRGRTRYRVRVGARMLLVPFAFVEPAE
ncbi:MAG TPA: SprT-like domain-containing protein [Intrasporangium sp.]|uniref:SprT-like domain-containing protein n=1 Tax=Intrasporangium sp. TaxID=1925024 RepID=UPI002D777DAB|nr:SprT-like domain-containing protein [Intrasporangium sp.]HET7397569.1 SprT-like domain-containing protein [Intrasporangium sp.]